MLDLEQSLSLFRCPVTGAPLEPASADSIDELNQKIARGDLRDVSGTPVDDPLEGALRPEGADFVYPVRDGIPNFLIDERLPLADDGSP